MRAAFVDTLFWVARLNKQDQHHQAALAAEKRLGTIRMVTTDEVLVEFLTSLAGYGPAVRAAAAQTVRRLQADPDVEVLPQTRDSFLAGLALYESRRDKAYSLTDCVSMHWMRQLGVTEVLTLDHHFVQEGFTLLLRT